MRKMLVLAALAVVATLSAPAVERTLPSSPSVVAAPVVEALFVLTQAQCLQGCFGRDRSCNLRCFGGPPSCEASCTATLNACKAACLANP